MTGKTATGWVLIAVGAFMGLNAAFDTIADLQNWHAATTPAIVGAIGKQITQAILLVLGGGLLPQVGEKP